MDPKKLRERTKKKLLANRVITLTDCWEWSGRKDSNGYGRTSFQGREIGVHRLSMYVFKYSQFRPELNVLHTCDNPICFNPAHLNCGTQRQNYIDWKVRDQYRKTA